MNALEKSSSFHFLKKKSFFFGIGASTCTQQEIQCLHCAGLSLSQNVAIVVVMFFLSPFIRTFLCAQLLLDPFPGLSLTPPPPPGVVVFFVGGGGGAFIQIATPLSPIHIAIFFDGFSLTFSVISPIFYWMKDNIGI